MYEVRLRSRRVRRELSALGRGDQERVLDQFESLSTEPRPNGTVKLEDGIYRLRIGNFRVFYLIDEERRRI